VALSFSRKGCQSRGRCRSPRASDRQLKNRREEAMNWKGTFINLGVVDVSALKDESRANPRPIRMPMSSTRSASRCPEYQPHLRSRLPAHKRDSASEITTSSRPRSRPCSNVYAEGELWEISNMRLHSVRNGGRSPRMHLIVDWAPPSVLVAGGSLHPVGDLVPDQCRSRLHDES
jgi:hypothetical protein